MAVISPKLHSNDMAFVETELPPDLTTWLEIACAAAESWQSDKKDTQQIVMQKQITGFVMALGFQRIQDNTYN